MSKDYEVYFDYYNYTTFTVDGDTSDGYHTFDELYDHRMVLTAALVSFLPDVFAWKSKKHSDGTMFDGMFIVGYWTPEGYVTYHYNYTKENWDLFNCVEFPTAPEWDGCTPEEGLERTKKAVMSNAYNQFREVVTR